MKRNTLLMGLLAVCILASGASKANAAFAVTLNSTGTTGYSNSDKFSLGFAFTLNSSVLVTDLGYYGLAVNAHEVGIFNAAQTLLTSATVAEDTIPDANGFGYVSIAPLLLLPGNYVLAGTSVSPDDPYIYSASVPPTYAPEITFIESRYVFTTPNDVLAYPNLTTANHAYFGPNFQFTAVPEPATWMVWGSLCAVGAVIAYYRRSVANAC